MRTDFHEFSMIISLPCLYCPHCHTKEGNEISTVSPTHEKPAMDHWNEESEREREHVVLDWDTNEETNDSNEVLNC